jgi:magnesium transporter
MDINYVQVPKKQTFKEVARLVAIHEKRTGKIPAVLVVENGLLIGEVLTSTLILQNSTALVEKHIKPLPTVMYNQHTDEVIKLFHRLPHNKIVVLDDNYSILGIIYSDDVLPLMQKNSSANLYQFAGVRQDEDVFDPFYLKVKHRYTWLIINLGTAFLAAGVVGLFHETISKFVLLASYMPIVAGMGGNTGTQTLAVMVRGIALGEIELKNSWHAILNEMGSGFLNGIITGLIVAIIALLFSQTPLIGLITAAAMIINLTMAGLAGSTIPLIMKRLGKDPATSATNYITTATDVCGFFFFLGLASIILK